MWLSIGIPLIVLTLLGMLIHQIIVAGYTLGYVQTLYEVKREYYLLGKCRRIYVWLG